MPIILALGRQRQKSHCKLKSSLVYTVRPYLQKKTEKTPSYMGKEEKEDVSCQLYIYRKIIPWL